MDAGAYLIQTPIVDTEHPDVASNGERTPDFFKRRQ